MTRVPSVGGLKSEQLPAYSRPPVVEVAVGVEFLPIDQLDTVELVRLHERWSDTYPKIELQPELPSPSRYASQLPLVLNTGVPPVRLWSLGADENLLLQVQADRLVINWRRIVDDAAYPRYDSLREEFLRRWGQLHDRLVELNAPLPQVAVVEVTYVNLISYVEKSDPSSVLTFFTTVPDLPQTQTLQVQRVAGLPSVAGIDSGGTVTLTGVTEEPGRLRLDVVTRLNVGDQEGEASIMDALDRAHEVGVRTFSASTTSAVQRSWGRVQ